MSWQKLGRIATEVEADPGLQWALKIYRSLKELILAERCRGWRITLMDLGRAWQEDQLVQARRDQA